MKIIKLSNVENENCPIIISKMIYENKKIYLEITSPCEFVENYDIKNFQKDYIIEKKPDKNPRKIAITDLYCGCGNKSQNEYYCLDSQKNLCSNCIGKEKDHSNHSIVNLNDDKIQIIIKDKQNINLNRNIKKKILLIIMKMKMAIMNLFKN